MRSRALARRGIDCAPPLVTASGLLAACAGVPPERGAAPPRVLFVGNSLTAANDLPGIVAALVRAAEEAWRRFPPS